MKLKVLATTLILGACALTGMARTNSARQAHQAAHAQQLANHSSRIEKSVISDIVGADIAAREAAKEHLNGISAENSVLINDLLKEAKKHIGKAYRSGAKGPSAFDCSGFSSYVYRQFGYSISPSSRQQYTEGMAVDRKDLRKGDLVFFTSRSSGKNVGHVGIVYEVDHATGGFSFIHASIKGVKISKFEGYYVPRYIGAKRIID